MSYLNEYVLLIIISLYRIQSSDGLIEKKNKEYHPASQRVAEAAEALMFVLFEHRVRRWTNHELR
jgi:hypothetical protein